MSIIERRRMLAIGLYCAMTTINLSAGMPLATAQALIGAAAPAFRLTDSNGRNLSLADFKGKTVVLEWTSHECPYVGKHYRGNNMQALQKKWTGQGVVWLSVISSAPGQPGYVSPQQANKLTTDRDAAPTAVLLDPTGKVGHAFGARTTPHMHLFNGEGAFVYKGGIDDARSNMGRDKDGQRTDALQDLLYFVRDPWPWGKPHEAAGLHHPCRRRGRVAARGACAAAGAAGCHQDLRN